ncbi:zinc finger, CCHC-type containing protein [Tanacetum coccineum]
MEEEKSVKNNEVVDKNVVEPDESDMVEPIEKVDGKEEVKDGTGVSQLGLLTNEKLVGTDIKLSLASHSYIHPLGIAKDVLIDVVGHVYPTDFVIIDIKEDDNKPFILGIPFLTTDKVAIRFDKGTITLKSGKNKISFFKRPESLCRVEKETKNDISLVGPTNTVNAGDGIGIFPDGVTSLATDIFDEKKRGSS